MSEHRAGQWNKHKDNNCSRINKTYFCELHGKCAHKTENHLPYERAKEIIREKQVSNVNDISKEVEYKNKQDFIYSNFRSLNGIIPSFVSVITCPGSHKGLIDTGADTSLIH